MVESADTRDLKSLDSNIVPVQVGSAAPENRILSLRLNPVFFIIGGKINSYFVRRTPMLKKTKPKHLEHSCSRKRKKPKNHKKPEIKQNKCGMAGKIFGIL